MRRVWLTLAAVAVFAEPALAVTADQPPVQADPSRFGEVTPPTPPANATRPATPGGVDPARFGEPATPKDAIGQPPVTILKSKEITPDSPAAGPADDGVDPKRFGGTAPDAAYGAFQRGLYKTAYNLALPRAEQGDAAAQTLIAELLTRGLGVAADQETAAKWYAKAAQNGVPAAQFQYALMQADGKFVPKDTAGSLKLMKAAADAGNTLAQFNLAQMYVQQDRGPAGLSKALPYYERAATTGLPDAQYAMAQIFASGVADKKQDLAEARRYLLLASKQGFDTAQLDLGTWMVDGRGGPRDAKGGFVWLKQAAEGGNVAAMNRLAKLYMNGIGTDPNSIDAAAWYFLARRAGLSDFEMADFLDGLTTEETKMALERANRLR